MVALDRPNLLLLNRRRFESGGVLVDRPSRVFMNYIARVLPSLGEDAVTLRPIRCSRLRRRSRSPATASIRLRLAAIKGSLRMVKVLRRLVHEPLQDVLPVRTADHDRWHRVGAAVHHTGAHPVSCAHTPQAEQRREAAEMESNT